MKVTLGDLGVGNLHSLQRALEAQGAAVVVARDPRDLPQARVLVLPGVANFTTATRALAPVRPTLRAALEAGLPTLGICAGMQLLFRDSEEGPGEGVGYFPGRVLRLRGRPVPHMGWEPLDLGPSSLFDSLPQGSHFYFAHSYAPPASTPGSIATATRPQPFAAAVERGTVWGVQFHPEKSHAVGQRVLANFLARAQEVV